MELLEDLYIKKYLVRDREDLEELIRDYFNCRQDENFFDLDYKDFRNILLRNLPFLYQRNFKITLDELKYLVQKYFCD